MHHSSSTIPSFLHQSCLFFFIIFSFLVYLTVSDPRISESGLYCGQARPPPSTPLIPTFVKEMESLSQKITSHHFATYHRNSTPPIYALAQCHRDLSQTDCLLCYAASRTRLPRCLPSLSGTIYLDGCFLRYDNYSFYGESVSASLDSVSCSNETFLGSGGDLEKVEFLKKVGFVVENVTRKAVEDGGFGVVGIKGVYALAQCWDSVNKGGCEKCLDEAAKKAIGCLPKKEGRGMNAGCYLRYSTQKFYSHGDLEHDHGFSALGVTIAVSLAAVAILMLSLFLAYASYIRLSKTKQERHNLGKLSISFNRSSLSYKYETLEKATDYFNPSRKLGQGGAGSVFLGTLPDGQTVAVKRLVFNTRQWVDEFFNEVNLISGIHHKNLVKLLGCSIEGPESLLVYEYVANKSLDQFLFDKKKGKCLSWKERFDIIVGTAEGLAFLHGGAHVRIIHRDIKSSNVLLDENFSPKIADFGLVRCFSAEQSHLSTGIAGTIGYMAPEYLVRGQLTEKADVYSFGVLVLEIVGGKRCNTFMEDSSSLLQTVWQHYMSNTLFQAIDTSIKDDDSSTQEDASNVLQIGLLCTQASPNLRPSMEQVVWMLINKDCEIPMPSQPPYINANLLGSESSKISNGNISTNSFASNPHAQKVETTASYSSLESSTSRSEELLRPKDFTFSG